MKPGPEACPWWQKPEAWAGALAFFVRLWFLAQLVDSPFFEPIPGGNDRSLYVALAQRVAQGSIFPQGVFEYMPLYPCLLGLIHAAAGSNSSSIMRFAWRFARHRHHDAHRRLALQRSFAGSGGMGGLLYAFYQPQSHSAITMPNTLNVFLLTLFATVCEESHCGDARDIAMVRNRFACGHHGAWFCGMLLISLACLLC